MTVGVTQSNKTISLCCGLGGIVLLMAALGGVMLGDEMSAIPQSDLVASGDDTASQQVQLALTAARDNLMQQEGLSDTARRVRLTALQDSTDAYRSMMDRLRQIKERDPALESAEAKTLLKSASAIADRLQERQTVPRYGVALDNAVTAAALIGVFCLFAGMALTFPVLRGVLKPFKALAAFLAAARAAP